MGIPSWRYSFGGRYPVTGIFIQKGAVYVASANNAYDTVQLFALRLADGHLLWRNTLGAGAGYPNIFRVDRDVLYMEAGISPGISAPDAGVVAIRLSDGANLWRAAMGHSYRSGQTNECSQLCWGRH